MMANITCNRSNTIYLFGRNRKLGSSMDGKEEGQLTPRFMWLGHNSYVQQKKKKKNLLRRAIIQVNFCPSWQRCDLYINYKRESEREENTSVIELNL